MPETDFTKWVDQGALVAFFLFVCWAIVRVGRWIAPRAEQVIKSHREFLDAANSALRLNANTLGEQSECLLLLTHCLVRAAANGRRSLAVLIEDSRIDARIITEALCDIVAEAGLTWNVYPTLGAAYAAITQADLLIVDLSLPDVKHTNTVRFLSECSMCPVIVYTGSDDEAALSAMRGTTVVRKPNIVQLVAEVRNVLKVEKNT